MDCYRISKRDRSLLLNEEPEQCDCFNKSFDKKVS